MYGEAAATDVADGSRRPGPRRKTSREALAREALRIADAEGLDALTVQRLAAAAGIGTMTVYGYFRSKDELLGAVVDAAVGDGVQGAGAAGWREDLAAAVTTVYDALARHPSLVEIRFRRPVLRPEALQFGERCMAALTTAGLPPDQAAAAFRLLFTFVFGYAGLSPARREHQARDETAKAARGLPSDRYPALTEHREAFASAAAGRAAFEEGLAIILDGIADRLARPATRRRARRQARSDAATRRSRTSPS